MFLCKETPYASDVCNVDRGSHQGAGEEEMASRFGQSLVSFGSSGGGRDF